MPEMLALTTFWEPKKSGLSGAFKTIEDVESFYEGHKDLFEPCTCEGGTQRSGWCERHSFCQKKPGTRLWVVWKFEFGFDRRPKGQVLVLEQIGELEPGEKQAALQLARKELKRIRDWQKACGVCHRRKPTDRELLEAWPGMHEFWDEKNFGGFRK